MCLSVICVYLSQSVCVCVCVCMCVCVWHRQLNWNEEGDEEEDEEEGGKGKGQRIVVLKHIFNPDDALVRLGCRGAWLIYGSRCLSRCLSPFWFGYVS
jgi:hypothetical protein